MSEAYDSAPIYLAVRKRHHDMQDRVRKLMTRETKFEEAIAKADKASAQLKDTIERVLKIPADATELQTMARNTSEQLARDRGQLADVQEELALVREAMKYADMAHEALHWARFADQALERYDREHGNVAEPLQAAE